MRSEFAETGKPDGRATKGTVGSLSIEIPNVSGTLTVSEIGGAVVGTVPVTAVTSNGENEIVNLSTDVKGDPVALLDHGDPAKHANILILPEGYQEAELPTFHADAKKLTDELKAVPGYAEHWDGFNIFYQDVKSADSGITDPRAGGAPKKTAFDVAFGDDGRTPRRCIMVAESVTSQNYASMRALADKVKADVVVLLANTAEYAGCAKTEGRFITVSKDARAARILAHELGHALFGLADEYSGGGVTCEPSRWVSGSANVTSTLNTLPWADIATSPARPTPLGSGNVVGAFEGGGYCDRGVYRPKESCMMRDLNSDLCPVCLREFDRFFETLRNGGDPAVRARAPGVKVTVTNTTDASLFVACTGIQGPGCSGWTYLEKGQTQTIETLGGEFYLDTSTVTGATIRWSALRLKATSAAVSIVADQAHPIAGTQQPASWNCAKSSFRNQQYWTCSGTSLHRCEANNAPVEKACANGCNSMPAGTDDTCR